MSVAPVPDDDAVAYDLDAVIAERDPVQAFTFRFGGEVYTLPSRPDLVAAGALAAGRLEEGLMRMLGDVQWERMKASDAVFDDVALLALFERYSEQVGDLGESGASANSSPRTAKR